MYTRLRTRVCVCVCGSFARWHVCRFSLIRNTSMAGFDPSLFRIVYSLYFCSLIPPFAFLSSGTFILHTYIRYSQDIPAANRTRNVARVWELGRLKYCTPKDSANFHTFVRSFALSFVGRLRRSLLCFDPVNKNIGWNFAGSEEKFRK